MRYELEMVGFKFELIFFFGRRVGGGRGGGSGVPDLWSSNNRGVQKKPVKLNQTSNQTKLISKKWFFIFSFVAPYGEPDYMLRVVQLTEPKFKLV